MPKFVAFFGGREGASGVILAVMQAEFDDVPLPSRAALAHRFGLSKTQVTKIIAEGVALGFFSTDPAAVPSSTTELREEYRRWISLELAFYARHMQPGQT
jgi:hypothetical protein